MYVLVNNDKTIHENSIIFSSEVFIEINKKFGSRFREPISAIDSFGKLIFNICWESEYYYNNNSANNSTEKIPYYCNFFGEDLLEEIDLLDFTFLEQYDVFFFEEINEYSYHIIKLIKKVFNIKRICSCDQRIKAFKELDIEFLDPGHDEKTGRFYAGHNLPVENNCWSVYSLMLSLTWAKKRHLNWNAKKNETILVIDFRSYIDGFGDIFRKIIVYINLSKKHGWKPLIYLNHGTQYADYEGEDCWKKYFAPVSDVKVEDLDKFSCWISVFENRPFDSYSKANPYLSLFSFDFPENVVIRSNHRTKIEIDKRIPKEFMETGKKLGLIIRTTDYDWLQSRKTDIERLLNVGKDYAERFHFDKIFIATESEETLIKAKRVYERGLYYIDQKRIFNTYEGDFLSSHFSKIYQSKYEMGADYLAVIHCLSVCDSILYNRDCGAVYLARNFQPNNFGKKIDFYSFDNAEIFILPAESLKFEKRIFIYGAGINGKIARKSLEGYPIDVIFCDKKAENGKYMMDGCEVISMETLKSQYNGEFVWVSPYSHRDQIKNDLIGLGIPEGKILIKKT